MSPVEVEGGSHERWAPSADLLILMAEGAPGNPGRHVLKAEIYAERKHTLVKCETTSICRFEQIKGVPVLRRRLLMLLFSVMVNSKKFSDFL